jgi:predicted DNA-binding protein
MLIKSDQQITMRLPKNLNLQLENIGEYFGISKSLVIKKFCEDGLKKFNTIQTPKTSQYFLERNN